MTKLSKEVLQRRQFNMQVNQALQANSIMGKLEPYIPKDECVIDVGAATGHFTHYFSPRCRHVYAIEAEPHVFAQTVKMADSLPNVTPLCFAAGCSLPYISEFYVDDKRLSNSSFRDLVGGQKTTLLTMNLDSILFGDVGFIKIDVEGEELDVLTGAEKHMLCSPNLLIEIYQPYSAYPTELIFSYLFERNYEAYFYSNGQLINVPTALEGVDAVENRHKEHDGDFLFVHKDYDNGCNASS